MTRQEKNEQFLLSSFLYGGNASYIEDLYTRFKADPKSVDPTWASYFGRLEDTAGDVRKNAGAPSWARPDWPQTANGELVAALDGNWGEIVLKSGVALGKKAAAEGTSAPGPTLKRAFPAFTRSEPCATATVAHLRAPRAKAPRWPRRSRGATGNSSRSKEISRRDALRTFISSNTGETFGRRANRRTQS